MKPKKSLGQNFLRDEKVLAQIISAADLKLDDNVLEIGSGEGALSAELIKRIGKLIMVEKDKRLAENIAHNFQFSIFNFQSISNDSILKFKNKAAVIMGDILKINIPKIIEKNNFQDYKVVANIPYYITSPIIRLFLETKYPPTEIILTVQKEVAERICARPGEMSILAVAVQYYAKAELLFHVDKKSFLPVPKVDSAVIRITPFPSPVAITRHPLPKGEDDNVIFFRVVKAGFSAKRKTLINNLSNSLHLDKKVMEEKIKKVGLNPTQRAQELSIADWKKLSVELRKTLPKPE